MGNSYPGPKLPDNIASTFENGIYTNRKLTQDEFFYKYHGVDNRTGRKYSWLTNKLYTSEDTLRQDLAIRHDWGVNITDVSKFRVPQLSLIKLLSQSLHLVTVRHQHNAPL
ncbi:hypothetical protein [Salmonella bongori]|uniref:hypothetical protein n=1 Tax=Salmonella bongori TaxID=54736 RepID=UPI0015C444E8|nr:hypothetical protein [Salmonella bongori]